MASSRDDNQRFGTAGSARCSILVVSSDELLLKDLMTAILERNSEFYGNKFQVNSASSVSLGKEVGNTDYIIIVVNPCSYNWDTVVEENINQMNKSYLCSRFCLVVDTKSIADICGENTYRISALKKKFAMPVLYGEFDIMDVSIHLSQRLLCLVNGVCCNNFPLAIEFLNSL